MGRFIVIDGLDGSGKETQAELLKEKIEKDGKKVRMISFPDYNNVSSCFVKMYLNGELGKDPSDTNAYAASMFFGADRYISYRTDWRRDYEDPETTVIANRYTTANAVHQLSKLPRTQWEDFLNWLWDFEYEKLGIPKPDNVIYLEMLPEISLRLISKRASETGRKIDIHEADAGFLERSYEAALYASSRLGWTQIKCYENGEPVSRETVHKMIIDALGTI